MDYLQSSKSLLPILHSYVRSGWPPVKVNVTSVSVSLLNVPVILLLPHSSAKQESWKYIILTVLSLLLTNFAWHR